MYQVLGQSDEPTVWSVGASVPAWFSSRQSAAATKKHVLFLGQPPWPFHPGTTLKTGWEIKSTATRTPQTAMASSNCLWDKDKKGGSRGLSGGKMESGWSLPDLRAWSVSLNPSERTGRGRQGAPNPGTSRNFGGWNALLLQSIITFLDETQKAHWNLITRWMGGGGAEINKAEFINWWRKWLEAK